MVNVKIKEQLLSLKNTPSRNDKMSLIEDYLNDALFEKTIKFLCNKKIKTNISSKKFNKEIVVEAEKTIEDFEQFIDFLIFEVDGKDSSIKIIQDFVSKYDYDKEYQELLTHIATKNLQIGVTVSTLNKVLNIKNMEELFDYKVQSGETFSKIKQKELVKDINWLGYYYITKKLDGVRVGVVKENNKITFYSRNGLIYRDVVDLEKEFMKNIYPDNTFYDGEVLAHNPDNLIASKLFSKTNSIMSSKNIKTGVDYHMFDTMPLEEFRNGKSKLVYSERRKIMEKYMTEDLVYILPVIYEGTDISMIETISQEMFEQGEEGIMINKEAIYEAKKVKTLLKVKEVISCDGRILGFYEGENKFKGSLGGLIVSYEYEKPSGEIIPMKVKVGGGISDDLRNDIWNNQNDYLGSLVEYIITGVTEDKHGELDVRFARLKRFREDKDTVSYEQ